MAKQAQGGFDPNSLGGARPKVTPDDLEADVAVLTVAGFEEFDVDDPESATGKRHTAVLTFQETGDKVLYLNKTQGESLVERLGKDPNAWTGQKVPVEKITTQYRGQKFPKVAVVPAEEWDDYLKPSRRRGK
jgi:hypothetical protein